MQILYLFDTCFLNIVGPVTVINSNNIYACGSVLHGLGEHSLMSKNQILVSLIDNLFNVFFLLFDV